MWRYSHAGDRVDSDRVVLIRGAVDLLSVGAAVGAAALLAPIPGLVVWPLTAFGTTATSLLVGGVDVLIARRTAGTA